MNAPTISKTSENQSTSAQRSKPSDWQRDHFQWQDDLRYWQNDQSGAVAKLKKLSEIVLRHGEALENHQAAVDRHNAMAEQRLHSAQDHREQLDEHARVEDDHRILMAHLVMMESIIDAMERR